jgi:hypothetical protein
MPEEKAALDKSAAAVKELARSDRGLTRLPFHRCALETKDQVISLM